MVNRSSFGAPYNYCDARCERCVFERDCVIARDLRNARWLDAMNGDDATWPLFTRGDTSVPHLDAGALDREPLRSRTTHWAPRSLFVQRLRRAGMNYSLTLERLLRRFSAPLTGMFRDAEVAAALVAPKVARLTLSVLPDGEPRFDPEFADDGHATLLLLEYLDSRTALALSFVCEDCIALASAFERSRAHLWELLAPLCVQIPTRKRAELARLVLKRRAPSPFFVLSN